MAHIPSLHHVNDVLIIDQAWVRVPWAPYFHFHCVSSISRL
jgi:hypothetical protein